MTDLIIGLPSIKHFNLLPILNDHISTIQCCEICSNNEAGSQSSDTASRQTLRQGNEVGGGDTTGNDKQSALHGGVTQNSTIPTQHSSYTGEMATLFAEINSITDNFATPTYSDPDELIQALQGLHLSEILEFDDMDRTTSTFQE